MITIDIVPFFRFVAILVVFGLAFYFFNVTVGGFTSAVGDFGGDYASALLSLWAALPAVVLLFAGIRLVMVMQRKGVQ